MHANPSTPSHRRFRGSPLDKALGAGLALLLIAVPPFVYGHIGIVYALVVLNGLLICGLREKMKAERAPAEVKPIAKQQVGFSHLSLAKAHGIFAGKPAPYAPDERLLFGLSAADLQTHLVVCGSTGTGMTSKVLRPLANKFLARVRGGKTARIDGVRNEMQKGDQGGLIVFDGMGSLSADFRGLKDYLLIDPGKPGKEAFRFRGESWREKRRPQRTNRNKN